jgi:DNA modification methylase
VKNIKTISIKCDCKDFLKLEDLTVMQGGLKERNETDYEKIKKSILTYSFSFPFFIWKSGKTNYLIDGTGRFNCLLKMQNEEGYLIPELPVVYIQCKNKADAKQKLLRLNSQYGRLSKESVLEFASDIDLNFDEIALPDTTICFEDEQETQETEGDDDIPDIDEKEKPNSERGCMYELGNSILMCGDSTSAEDVARLMGGEKADITFTSPPYNMQKSGIARAFESKKVKDSYGIKNGTYDVFSDNLSDEEYSDLLCKSLKLGLTYSDDALFNIGILDASKNGIVNMLQEFRNNFCDILIWNKSSCMPLCLPTQKNLVNHICELIFCFNQKGTRAFSHSQWELGKMTNRIDTEKQNKNEFAKEHHATFPLALPEYVLKMFCENSVIDLFGGTGTTLIAAEKLGKRAYLMELSPHYCDLIRKRYTKWAKENGKPITSGCLE